MDITPPTETPPPDTSAAPAKKAAFKLPPYVTPNRLMFGIGGLIIVLMIFGNGMNVAGHLKFAKKCQTGDIDVCTALIEAKNATDKQRGVYYGMRGFHYSQKGVYDKAIADFNSAIAANSAGAVIYAYRANAYFKMGNYAEAVKDFGTAIRMDSKAPDYVYCGLIDAEYHKGDIDAGNADLQKLKTMAPQAPCLSQLSIPSAPIQPVYAHPPSLNP